MPLIGLLGVYMTGYNPFGDNYASEYSNNFDPSVCSDRSKYGHKKISETADYYGCFDAGKEPYG